MNSQKRLKILLESIRVYIKFTDKRSVTKEYLSHRFDAKESDVEQCLHKLNLEGLVSQAVHNGPPFDIVEYGTPGIKNRRADFVSAKVDGRWTPDYYVIKKV